MNTLLEVQPTQEPNLLATTFQNTLVPSVTYEDVRFEAYGQTLPKEEVGGDLVDLVTAGSDVVAYVADVSGHGLLAGLLAGMVKTAVRYGVHLGQELPILLETLNHVLPTVKAPNMFATFAGLRFDGSHEVEFTTAGHVPLLQYRRRQGDVIRHSIPQLPLGLFEAPGYVSGRVRYGAGDVFLLVTDGIVEAADRHDTQFGFERIEEILRELEGHPLPEIFDVALDAVAQHGIQHDDQTLLLVRALSSGRQADACLM